MNACDYVVLRGGLALPLVVVRLAWNLEERGVRLGADGGMLTIGPRELITDEDRALLRQWKPHVLALLAYTADAHGSPQ